MLELTPKELSERQALTVNPCKTCQPVGALYAALGVHNCMPHSHGSQGCVSYHRTLISRHFKEPAVASTSSFTEGASVFGGGSNLKTAVKNVFDIYKPDIIAVHTTCLSETIGDDLNAYIQDIDIPEGKYVIHANTPSYSGSHVLGFANMLSGFIEYLAVKGEAIDNLFGVFPGFVNPGDIREIKRLLGLMKTPSIIFPDQSGVLDAPMTGIYRLFPDGGTKIEDIKRLGRCKKVLALGMFASHIPATKLERKCGVKFKSLPLPVGVSDTDKFVMAMEGLSGKSVAKDIETERGQLIDIMLDSHQYLYGKKVAVFGDPDHVIGLTHFALELGMLPKLAFTGSIGDSFVERLNTLFKEYGAVNCLAKAGADLFELHQRIKNERVDLLIGTSYGKQIAKAENIPFVRVGFPVLDRYVHPYLPIVAYVGGMRLVELILNALMDRIDMDANDEDFDVVM
jgi:nitrogenase molybdenum-iron protein beta chain